MKKKPAKPKLLRGWIYRTGDDCLLGHSFEFGNKPTNPPWWISRWRIGKWVRCEVRAIESEKSA